MKILHVIDQLNAGGAERVCIDLANLTHVHGTSIGLLVLLNESTLDSMVDPAISIYYLRRNSKINLRKYFEAASIVKQYDIIHIHMRHVYRYMALVKILGNLKNKFVLHDHFGDIRTQKAIPFLFGSLFRPHYYLGVSKELTTWAIQNLGLKEKNVFLLTNIVRQSKVNTTMEPCRDLVIVSNIRRTKNIEFAVRLAQSLHLSLDIIGQVVDPVYYQELKEMTADSTTDSRITFIHDCYDVQPRLHAYRMALHTARSETGPLVLMEYLAKGINFLAYQTGEVAATLSQELPGFFMDDFDETAWKERISQRMDAPMNKESLIRVFNRDFDEEKYFTICQEIYQTILRS